MAQKLVPCANCETPNQQGNLIQVQGVGQVCRFCVARHKEKMAAMAPAVIPIPRAPFSEPFVPNTFTAPAPLTNAKIATNDEASTAAVVAQVVALFSELKPVLDPIMSLQERHMVALEGIEGALNALAESVLSAGEEIAAALTRPEEGKIPVTPDQNAR